MPEDGTNLGLLDGILARVFNTATYPCITCLRGNEAATVQSCAMKQRKTCTFPSLYCENRKDMFIVGVENGPAIKNPLPQKTHQFLDNKFCGGSCCVRLVVTDSPC